jgi:hypothetical protein
MGFTPAVCLTAELRIFRIVCILSLVQVGSGLGKTKRQAKGVTEQMDERRQGFQRMKRFKAEERG